MDRPPPLSELAHAEESFRIRRAAFTVSNVIGYGFLEGVYHECLALEFAAEAIPFRSMPKLPLTYRGQTLRQRSSPSTGLRF